MLLVINDILAISASFCTACLAISPAVRAEEESSSFNTSAGPGPAASQV